MPWKVLEREGQYCVIKESDGSTEKCHPTRGQAEAHMRALYANEPTETRRTKELAPVELRNAQVSEVNFPKRLIEIVAVPYEQEAVVEYRGMMWLESFDRGAFAGLETAPREIRANREHDMADIVGKAIQWFPDRAEGCVGLVKIAKTPRGDETLELADEDMLSASAGFAARPSDQLLDKVTMRRRIRKAFMDHVAFVGAPAYAGAGVLSVRHQGQEDGQEGPSTPMLDDVVAWMESRRRSA